MKQASLYNFLTVLIFLSMVAVSPCFLAAQEVPAPQSIEDMLANANSVLMTGNIDSAAGIGQAALDLAQRQYGESDTTYANVLHLLGKCYYFKSDFQECISYNNRALTIREKLLGPEHPDVAKSLNNLATAHADNGDYTEAEVLHRRALSIREKNLGPEHVKVAQSLNNLALISWRQGRFSEAGPLYERALDIAEKAMGNDHPSLVHTLNNLAILYQDKGSYAEAEAVGKRAVSILKRSYGPDNPYLPSALISLANVYQVQGKRDEAEPLYIEARSIWEKNLGPENPNIAICLDNLAMVYAKQGRLEDAENLHLEALAIREKSLGPEHPDVALTLDNLAALYSKQARFSEAESFQQRSLSIRKAAQGPEHPLVATDMYNLANIHYEQGNYSAAESLYQEALAVIERKLGPYHPQISKTLGSMAILSVSRSQIDESAMYYRRAQSGRRHFVKYVFSYASEDQKMRYLEEYPLVDHSLYSAALLNDSDDLRKMALEMALYGKGAILDAISAEREAAYLSYDNVVREMAQSHSRICGEISSVTLAGDERLGADIFRKRLGELYQLKDSLEFELSRSCSEFKTRMAGKEFQLEDVSEVLPNNAVLWEFLRYTPYDFNKTGQSEDMSANPRYLVFTLDHSGSYSLKDLGDAALIDSLVGAVRRQIDQARIEVFSSRAAKSEKRLMKTTQLLYRKIFDPLKLSLGTRSNLFISPDGQLNLFPFEILCNNDGGYVIEDYEISYLSSGRDLLRYKQPHTSNRNVLTMADPNFDFHLTAELEAEEKINAAPKPVMTIFNPVRGSSECIGARFDALPNTQVEVKAVAETLQEKAGLKVDSFSGDEASEAILKEINSPPRVLHLATHGYFCEDIDLVENEMTENPLLRSGLALAGANHLNSRSDRLSGEDGILTAFEASGLNLVGTELVALSACESGVGQVKNGEGVYGLRRAFQHAGARTIVMSLWKVPDQETRELMDNFYSNWSIGLSKKRALHGSILYLIKTNREKTMVAHPFLWGGFILAGDPD
jgi:CHAT domain-containing protein/tetratricopeptide (TPR) repeat protein